VGYANANPPYELNGSGFKANYFDVETGERFWISGPRKDGQDRLYSDSSALVEIDPDVAEEYWREIRGERFRCAADK